MKTTLVTVICLETESAVTAVVMSAWLALYAAVYALLGPDLCAPVQSNDAQDL